MLEVSIHLGGGYRAGNLGCTLHMSHRPNHTSTQALLLCTRHLVCWYSWLGVSDIRVHALRKTQLKKVFSSLSIYFNNFSIIIFFRHGIVMLPIIKKRSKYCCFFRLNIYNFLLEIRNCVFFKSRVEIHSSAWTIPVSVPKCTQDKVLEDAPKMHKRGTPVMVYKLPTVLSVQYLMESLGT